jgi:hypothetical protein
VSRESHASSTSCLAVFSVFINRLLLLLLPVLLPVLLPPLLPVLLPVLLVLLLLVSSPQVIQKKLAWMGVQEAQQRAKAADDEEIEKKRQLNEARKAAKGDERPARWAGGGLLEGSTRC